MRLCTFKDRTLPFFRTISHPYILSSLILEIPLDTICTFLFGLNGRHAINLFKATTSALGALAWDETAKDKELTSIAVTASLAVLERIVELNQGAQVIAEFTSIVDDLLTTIPEQLFQARSRSLARLRQRLGVGAAMPLSGGCPPQQKSHRPVFELGQDLHGALYKLGPRHDNDYADIFDIKILPTTEENQSSRLEYLPSSDPAKHHLPGLAGLLDRQFRVLREDTVGHSAIRCRLNVSGSPNPPMPNGHPSDRTMAFGISSIRILLCFDLNSIGKEGSRLWLSLTNLTHWRRREPRSEKNGGGILNSCRSMLLYALSLLQVVLSSSPFVILLRRLRKRGKMANRNVRFDQPDNGAPPISDPIFLSVRIEPG